MFLNKKSTSEDGIPAFRGFDVKNDMTRYFLPELFQS